MMTDKKITRIAIISDQAIYLHGMSSLLLSLRNFRLVGEAKSGAEAIQLCELTEPDMIILDLNDTREQSREIAYQVHQRWPVIKLILPGSPPEEDELDNGHLYYFDRNVSEDEFKVMLEEVGRRPLMAPAQNENMHTSFQHHAETGQSAELEETLRLINDPPPVRHEDVIARELVMAGKIQADILPEQVPDIPGWDISAALEPARETSGDFYDFIPLSDRKWGIVMADVTDKGMGAAIFMALSNTLVRTYATRFPTLPAVALSAVSERILSDTRGGMFVTTFFGILEPHTGRFTYANAGHPPAYLISTQRGKESVDPLRRTGMALGVSEQAQWKQKTARFNPGDFLILYTDGITEAQNSQGEFFGEERLLDLVLSKGACCASEIRDTLLDEVHRFVGRAPQHDDITLVIIRRIE